MNTATLTDLAKKVYHETKLLEDKNKKPDEYHELTTALGATLKRFRTRLSPSEKQDFANKLRERLYEIGRVLEL